MLGDCPKKVAQLIDLFNLPSNLREFAGGQSQMSHLSFFIRVWSHIKTNKLQVDSPFPCFMLMPDHIKLHYCFVSSEIILIVVIYY